MRMIFFACLACAVLPLHPASAQSIQTFAGLGVSAGFVHGASNEGAYSPRYLPQLNLDALIHLEGRVSLKTGIAYAQKGWKTLSGYTDSAGTRSESTVLIRLHALTVPLQISYAFKPSERVRYSIQAGMNYLFFVQADGQWTLNDYRGGRLLHTQTVDYHPTISFIPDGSRLKNTFEGSVYYRFNPMLRLDFLMAYRNRYILQIFGESGLSDLSAVYGVNNSLRLQSIGVSCMVALQKAHSSK